LNPCPALELTLLVRKFPEVSSNRNGGPPAPEGDYTVRQFPTPIIGWLVRFRPFGNIKLPEWGLTNESARVNQIRRVIMHRPIEVAVPSSEPQRILSRPSTRPGVVIAGAVVLQPRLAVKLARRVLEAIPERRAALAHHVAEAVVADGVLDRPGVVGQVAHRPEPVQQVPRRRPRPADPRKQPIHAI